MPQKESINSRQVLATYIDDMVTAKMGANIDQEKRAQARQELEEQLEQAFQRGMVEALPDAQLIKLNELLDRDASDTEVEQVFESAGVKYEDVMLKVLGEFRKKYVGDVQTKPEEAPVVPEAQANVAAAEVQMVPTEQTASQGAGEPVQGTVSEVPGASDVEGMANNQEVR